MSVYTVHQPPLRAADDLADPLRFVFVRDGFHVWAFLLTPLWLLWRRLWLVLVCYVVFIGLLDAALTITGVPAAVTAAVNILVSLLIGLEASTLHRFTLRRRGWRDAGVVSGDDQEDAERRFFDRWAPPRPAPAAAPPSPSAASRLPQAGAPPAGGIIGLFPEPGAQR